MRQREAPHRRGASSFQESAPRAAQEVPPGDRMTPMGPLVGVPETIRRGLAPYREVFCRAEGFEHISRYVTGLILSPNKTLQGIHDLHVWEDGTPPVAGPCTKPSLRRPGMQTG